MIGTVTLALLAVITALLAWNWYESATFFGKLGLKGPPPLPIFGNLFGFKIGVHTAVENWTKEYGKTFGVSRGAKRAIVTSDLEFAREIMIKRFRNFVDRQIFPLRPELLKHDLMALRGERWKAMRETVMAAFSRTKMQKMIPMVIECADETMESIEETRKKEDGVVEMTDKMAVFGIDVGSLCFFATKLGTQDEKLVLMREALKIWTRFREVYLPWIFTMLFPWTESLFALMGCSVHPLDTVDFFSKMLKDIIDERKLDPKASENQDFLQLLMNAEELPSEPGVPKPISSQPKQKRGLSEIAIFSTAMGFFTGNTETSPSSLAYVLYALAIHPEVQDRVVAELDEVMEGDITMEKMNKLTYTEMMIKETLRVFPIAATVDRICQEDCVIKGVKVPKGISVEIAIKVIHESPENWTDPEKFDPERFSPENKGKIDPMTWLAFGQGPRMCLGQRFAMVEMYVILAKLLTKYRVEPCSKTEHPPTKGKRGLLAPVNGILLRVVPRKDAAV